MCKWLKCSSSQALFHVFYVQCNFYDYTAPLCTLDIIKLLYKMSPTLASQFSRTPCNSLPSSLLCRDEQLLTVREWVGQKVREGQGGALYISGAPGTGKTACVTHLMEEMKVRVYIYMYTCVYVRRKVRIRTIRGLYCANLGSSLSAVNPRIITVYALRIPLVRLRNRPTMRAGSKYPRLNIRGPDGSGLDRNLV